MPDEEIRKTWQETETSGIRIEGKLSNGDNPTYDHMCVSATSANYNTLGTHKASA